MSESPSPSVAANDPARLLADRAWLVRIATVLLGDAGEAEDLAQEVSLRALASPPRAGEERPWLRRVAQNLASRWRARRAWRAQWERGAARPEREPSSAELVARVQAQRAVADAVLKLADPDREVVLLRYFDDLPPAAIAARLELPVETVRTRLKRALARLRERLDAAHGGREAWGALLAPWMGVATMHGGMKVALAAGVVLAASLVVQQTLASRARPSLPPPAVASAPSPAAAAPTLPAAAPSPAEDPGAAPRRESERIASDASATRRIRITGRVVDAVTRGALPGARATVTAGSRDAPAPVVADQEGRFTVEWSALGEVWFDLVVTERHHAPLQKYISEPMDRRDTDDGAHLVNLGELALETGVVVRGHALTFPERTAVANAELFVLSGAPLQALEWNRQRLRPQGRTDASGAFEFAERVAVQREAAVVFARTETGVGFAPLALLPGKELVDDAEIPFEATGELVAVVTDQDGAPMAGAVVQARPLFPPLDCAHYEERNQIERLLLDDGWKRIFEATTGADGVARLAFLPEGRSDPAWEGHAGHMQSYLALASYANGASRGLLRESFLLKRGESTRVELTLRSRAPWRSLVLHGRITSASGDPIPDARIVAQSTTVANSDEAGLYETGSFNPNGDLFTLEVVAAGFAPYRFTGKRSELAARVEEVRDGASGVVRDRLELDVVLHTGLAVRGVVVDERGAPVERAGVRLWRMDDAGHREQIVANHGATGGDGRFEFEGVAAGDWMLEVDGALGFRRSQARHVAAGDDAIVVRLVHEWPAKARLVAEIVAASGGEPQDPTEAHVRRVGHADGSGPGAQLTHGQVVVDHLFPGRWELELRTRQGGRLRRAFEITEPEQELHQRFEVAGAGELLGHVKFPEGRAPPYAGVFVIPSKCHAVNADGRPLGDVTDGFAHLDARGRFHFKDVLPDTPLRVWIQTTDAFAEQTVTVAAGASREIELVPVPSPHVTWRLAGALPTGILVIEISRDGEIWAEIAWSFSPARDAVLREEFVAPGPLRWRARFTSDEVVDPNDATSRVEGSLEAVAGRDATIDVVGLH